MVPLKQPSVLEKQPLYVILEAMVINPLIDVTNAFNDQSKFILV
jgi:hypothetical protein